VEIEASQWGPPQPFALLTRAGGWLTTLVVVLVAYPILALDQIGSELQNPFDRQNLGHLPLDEICETIERNLLALRDADPGRATVDGRGPGPLKSGSGHEIRQERWHES
jgi:predicted membrane chloride channel (bestrophin family)